MLLTGNKLLEYVHGSGRCLPSLRRKVPEPFVAVNPSTALKLGISNDDKVAVETPGGKITVKAKLTNTVAPDVVSAQHGWWQECAELRLPGYDPYASAGANINLIYSTEHYDLLSGSFPLRGYPCRVRKVTRST